jgi:hypothetical protein
MLHFGKQRRATLVFFVVLSAAPCPTRAQTQQKGGARPVEFGVAAEGYLSNRESFDSFTCKFTVTTAKAQSVQNALDGVFIDAVVSEGLWVVDKDRVKYELVGDPNLLTKALSAPRIGNKIGLPFDSEGYLTDGKIQMRHAPEINCANVRPPGVAGPGIKLTPFGMGIMGEGDVVNPGRVLRDCADGKVFGRYDGSKLIDGIEALAFSRGEGEDYRLEYQLNPKQGFNPIRITGESPGSDQLDYRAFVTYRACTGERWFPERSVVVWNPDRKDPPFRIREIKLNEINLGKPPADSFYLDMTKGTQVSDPTSQGGYYYLDKPERITLNDLQAAYDRCKAKAAGGPAQPAAVRNIGWIWAINAGILAVMAGIAVWFYVRMRKPRTAPNRAQ